MNEIQHLRLESLRKASAHAGLGASDGRLGLLARISHELIIGGKPDAAVLERIFRQVGESLGCELFFCFLIRDDPALLHLVAAGGLSPAQKQGYAQIRVGRYLCGMVAERRECLIVEDLQDCAYPEAEALQQAGVTCYAGFPMVAAGRMLGTIAFATRSRAHFDESELQLVQILCDQVAATFERARLFEQMRVREGQLGALFDCAKVGAAVLTPRADRFLRVNEAFCAIIGYSADELADLGCDALTHPDDRAQMARLIEELLAGERSSFIIEKRYLHKSGTIVWVENSISMTRDGTDKPLYLMALCQDVTRRKQAESLLVEQKYLLELIASGHPQDQCLTAITEAIGRLQPHARALVLVANPQREAFEKSFASDIPRSFGLGIEGRLITANALGTCGRAVYAGEPVTCSDIANSDRWSEEWREHCISHGIRACHSQPVISSAGRAVASLMLCLDEARELAEWERRIAEFGAHVAGIAIDRDRNAEALRDTEQRLRQELSSARQLQQISSLLIQKGDADGLYRGIVDAAAALTRSDAASMQMLEGNQLRLLASRGFHPESASFWEWVDLASGSSCAASVSSGQRVVVRDVDACEFMSGTDDLHFSRLSGIRAVQSTPLVSRGGRVVGIISTHWKEPREPSENEMRLLDVLARQAADLVERAHAEDALRLSEERFHLAAEATNDAIWDWDLATNQVWWNEGVQALFGFSSGEVGPDAAWWYDHIHAEDRERVVSGIHAVIDGTECYWRDEYRLRRADGDYAFVFDRGCVMREESGKAFRILGAMQDLTERRRSEKAVRESEERLRFALEAGRLGSWEFDFTMKALQSSETCKAHFGRAPAAAFAYADLLETIHPEDRGHMQAQVMRSAETGAPYNVEYRAIWPNGELHWIEARGQVRRDETGRTVKITGVTLDVTARKNQEEHQKLLLNELNHRVKNTLATIQSIARQTLRRSQNTEEAQESFESRLLALSKAHDVLTQKSWEGAPLRQIIEQAVVPYCGPGRDHFRIEGPDVWLSPKFALALALALHELCTNAAKYGALSKESGHVDVSWSLKGYNGSRALDLTWRETGGPPVEPPTRRGFGSRLVEKGLQQELHGEVQIDYAREGVVCAIKAPLIACPHNAFLGDATAAEPGGDPTKSAKSG